jgi:hypothetical protein
MAKVIAMDDYLNDKLMEQMLPAPPENGEPFVNDRQIWSKDYSKLENVVFGVLKIREVLNYYLYYEDVWPYLLLNLLDAAAGASPEDQGELREAAAHLRNYIIQAVDAVNRKNMYAALFVLDLIEKTPGFKRLVQGDPDLA